MVLLSWRKTDGLISWDKSGAPLRRSPPASGKAWADCSTPLSETPRS